MRGARDQGEPRRWVRKGHGVWRAGPPVGTAAGPVPWAHSRRTILRCSGRPGVHRWPRPRTAVKAAVWCFSRCLSSFVQGTNRYGTAVHVPSKRSAEGKKMTLSQSPARPLPPASASQKGPVPPAPGSRALLAAPLQDPGPCSLSGHCLCFLFTTHVHRASGGTCSFQYRVHLLGRKFLCLV